VRRRQLRRVVEERDVDVRVPRLSLRARATGRRHQLDAARCRRRGPRGASQRQHAAMLVRVRRGARAIRGRRIAALFPSGLGALACRIYQLAVLGTQMVRDEQEVQRGHHMAHPQQQREPQPGGKRARTTGARTARHGSELTGLIEPEQGSGPALQNATGSRPDHPAGAMVSSRRVSSVLGVVAVVALVGLGGVALARVLLLGGGGGLLRAVLRGGGRRRGRLHRRARARLGRGLCRGRSLGEGEAGDGEHEGGGESAKRLLDHG